MAVDVNPVTLSARGVEAPAGREAGGAAPVGDGKEGRGDEFGQVVRRVVERSKKKEEDSEGQGLPPAGNPLPDSRDGEKPSVEGKGRILEGVEGAAKGLHREERADRQDPGLLRKNPRAAEGRVEGRLAVIGEGKEKTPGEVRPSDGGDVEAGDPAQRILTASRQAGEAAAREQQKGLRPAANGEQGTRAALPGVSAPRPDAVPPAQEKAASSGPLSLAGLQGAAAVQERKGNGSSGKGRMQEPGQPVPGEVRAAGTENALRSVAPAPEAVPGLEKEGEALQVKVEGDGDPASGLEALSPAHGGAARGEGSAQGTRSAAGTPQAPREGEIRAALGQEAWEKSMARQVLEGVERGDRRMTLRLHPASLGHIEVNLSTDEGGARIHFSTQHAAVKEAMEAALPRLREMFHGSGMNLAEASVSRHGGFAGGHHPGAQGSAPGGGDGRGGGLGPEEPPADLLPDPPLEEERAFTPGRGGSALDYYV